ncbi:hypothetical protein [Mesorhizobium humile]|uniref:Uncharacterized protein n=1 Tax=Mesorhizobium humile TaxID=3072313 RepID=A0ABU4YDZ1_9HYPH|nr:MULTISPECIES: hypothetical protein [unclassified Mesorhizobium]MDX8459422.1 hypothetical protein [Mesorhizobium sp. VK2D]MDX8484134.1 hypothetical protein [Mesorhizobium sp. VK2B]
MACYQQSVSGKGFNPHISSLYGCKYILMVVLLHDASNQASPLTMRKVVISLFAILAGTSFAMAAGTGCDAFKWPVEREQALFPEATAAQSGATLTVGQAVDFSLEAADTVSFEVPPERAPAAGTFGATANVTVPPEGELQVSLSDEAWIDVVQDGKSVKSAAFSGVKSCPGIRKSVRFKLAGGAAIIQLSGAKKADLKVAVLTPE